jgi:poly(A) polymerase
MNRMMEPPAPTVTPPVILSRADHPISRKQLSPGTLNVLYRLKEAGFTAYIAGGGVRDLLVGKHPKDFDVATDARPEQVRRLFRHCRLIGRRFRLAHVHEHNEVIEVSTFRANVADAPSSKEKFHQTSEDGMILRDNVYGTPEQDAHRRDFTINAMFYNIVDYTIIDYVGGLADIRDKMVRTIGEPEVRMAEDPVRMIRAVRFASILDFGYEPATERAILNGASRLAQASPARMFEEVQKLFFCGHSRRVLEELMRFGLLAPMMPELDEAMRADERDRQWLDRVTRQLDTWRSHKVRVTPELLFSLLFGLVHERRIAGLSAEGLPLFPAADRAVSEHLIANAPHILVPKVMGRHMAQIMAVQPYFQAVKEGKVKRFMQRPCFHDAYIYFKMRARFDQRDSEALQFWDERIRAGA